MKISKIINNNKGFTLIELIIVIAGIAALGSFTVPNILRNIKLNRLEETKATMNLYAIECLDKLRTDENFKIDEKFEGADADKLSTLGYQFDGELNTCQELTIKPANENEKDLYSMTFMMDSNGKIRKLGKPNDKSDDESFFNSCKRWAGVDCDASDELKNKLRLAQDKQKRREACLESQKQWLSEVGGTGVYSNGWDDSDEGSCDRTAYFWEFSERTKTKYEEKEKQATTQACKAWIDERLADKTITANGPITDPAGKCEGRQYWFHSGKKFDTEQDWLNYDVEVRTAESDRKRLDCEASLETALKEKIDSARGFTPGPHTSPFPCGVKVWTCNMSKMTQAEYNNSICAKKNQGLGDQVKEDVIPPHCKDWTPPSGCGGFFRMNSSYCTCK